MSWKNVFAFLFLILVVVLLGFYWFFPFGASDFIYLNSGYVSSNFSEVLNDSANSIGNDSVLSQGNLSAMQFYPNMRYPTKEISYWISNRCSLQKADEMRRAIQLLDNKTLINFYEVQGSSVAEISVTCQSTDKFDGNFFIAGEGGPTKITQAGKFNVILSGEVSLIRESKCENPNVGLHELLHALGFDHSSNPNNIMYNISRCEQTIGDDTVQFLDEIYSIPSLPDLEFENASAKLRGRYLDMSFTLRNNGLANASNSVVKVYADEKLIKEVSVDKLDLGYGRTFSLTNLFIPQLSIDRLRLEISTVEPELDKANNELDLGLKKG